MLTGYCLVCGKQYDNHSTAAHTCLGPSMQGHAQVTPAPIDYERIRQIIREELARVPSPEPRR